MTWKFILPMLLVGMMQLASGQIKQTSRLEEEIKDSEEGYTVISLKQEGLALVRDLNKFVQGKKKWKLEIVDTTLSPVWSTELEIESRLILVGYEYNPGHLYLLFREGQNEFHNFELFTIPFYERTITNEKVNFELNFKLTHFTMAGTSAVFGGEVNGEAAILLYNQHSDHPKVLPGLFMKYISLLDVRVNQNQSFNVFFADQRVKTDKKIMVRTFDQDGNILIEDIIPFDSRYTVLSGLTSALERDELLLTGTYAETGDRQAMGIFSVIVDPFKEQTVFYTDFASLDHFLDYLPARKAEKIKSKVMDKKTQGQTPYYTAYVLPFRVEERNDGFYLLSEMYYPTTTLNSYPAYGTGFYNPYAYGYYPYGISPYTGRYYNPSYGNQSSASDVKMIQSMVVRLDAEGKPVKSVSMGLEVKQLSLEQVGDFLVARDSILLVYKKEGNLLYQKEPPVESDEPDEGESVEKKKDKKPALPKINLLAEGEILKNNRDEAGAVRHWYGNHFFVWGYQTVKDKIELNATRHIFYVSRITVD